MTTRMKATMPERGVRNKLKKRVKAYGGEIRAVSWLGRSNAPDVLCLLPFTPGYRQEEGPAWVFYRQKMPSHPFVETKRLGKDATEAQAREHERMRDAGCVVLVITNEQELDAWLPPL